MFELNRKILHPRLRNRAYCVWLWLQGRNVRFECIFLIIIVSVSFVKKATLISLKQSYNYLSTDLGNRGQYWSKVAL